MSEQDLGQRVHVRVEEPDDHEVVRALVGKAFGGERVPDLLDDLRARSSTGTWASPGRRCTSRWRRSRPGRCRRTTTGWPARWSTRTRSGGTARWAATPGLSRGA